MSIYGNFVWWQGVVEDRIDPLMLGRCRVRILGYHTDDKHEIPTNCLPWATIMQPTTSAAMSGIGTTPTGPVEGTWVIGFFRDGEDAQEPVVMGTIGGKPEDIPDATKGFNDPKGKYPLHSDGEVLDFDTSKLARGTGEIPLADLSLEGNAEKHDSLIFKRKQRQTNVPKALAGDMTQASVENTADDFYKFEGKTGDGFGSWHEPNPRYGGITSDSDTFRENDDGRGGVTEISYKAKDGTTKTRKVGSSMYPKNHVRVSESGHVEEWDDTPYAERLHRYHKTGTFEEIQADGTKITKVTGDDYEIVAGHDDNSGNKKVFIYGNCDLTIMKDVRLKVEGSMVHEVTGNYHLNVHGDMRTKITGNHLTEVLSQRKTTVNLDDALTVGDSQSITVGASGKGSCTFNVAETYGVNAKEILLDSKTHTITTSGTTFSAFAEGSIGLLSANTNIAATGIVSISAAPGVVNIHSASMINIGMLTTPTININGLALVDITSKKLVGVGAPKILLAAALGLTESSKFHIVGTKSYRAIAGKINLN